jgi:hypothetical protein
MKDLNSYYFSFEKTGNEKVDNLLYAICRAGKAFHSTSQWNDDVGEMYENVKGDTPIEWIQNAANDIANE